MKKIINIIGGLGNQMFQYAFALSVAYYNKKDTVLIDTHQFNGYPLHNGYEIERIFKNARMGHSNLLDLTKIHYPIFHYRLLNVCNRFLPKRKTYYNERAEMKFDKNAFTKAGNVYFSGFWQCEKYFKPIRNDILDVFYFPKFEDENNMGLERILASNNCVSLHIRRGDYVNHKSLGNICDVNYYWKAIDEMKQRTDVDYFIVFSDDINWCKENLKGKIDPEKIIYVDWNKGENSYRDMQLMSLCNHNIIANSSFSWWGAWLNNHTDKIVMTPAIWRRGYEDADIIPEEWIKIEI